LVLSIRITETSTTAQIRPHGKDGGSINANGIRYAASDVTIGRMHVKPLIVTTVAITIAITDVAKRIPAVGEDRKREDAAGRTTIRAVVRSQSMVRGFARAIKSVEERLRDVS
jgi:hypothetical protein